MSFSRTKRFYGLSKQANLSTMNSSNPVTNTSNTDKHGNSRPGSGNKGQSADKEHSKDSFKSHSCDEKKFNQLVNPDVPPLKLMADKMDIFKDGDENAQQTADDGSPNEIKRRNSNTSSRKENSPSSGIPLLKSKNSARALSKSPLSKTLPIKSSTSPPLSGRNISNNMLRHSLETQFVTKRKRLDQLRKDLLDKQKTVIDLYQNLAQLKKKLEQNGRNVTLDKLKMVDFEEKKVGDSSSAGDELSKAKVDPEIIANIQNSLNQIPSTFSELCKSLIDKRAALLEILEHNVTLDPNLQEEIGSLKMEGYNLEQSIQSVFLEQEKKISEVTSDWQNMIENSGSPLLIDKHVHEMQRKIKHQEAMLADATLKIKQLETQLEAHIPSTNEKIGMEETIAELNQKVKSLEKDLEAERRVCSDHRTKNKSHDQTLKDLKQRVKELDTKSKDGDTKCGDLQKRMRNMQEQARLKELQWIKEKEEFQRSIKTQEALLQKMTADRNHFETRLKATDEVMAEREKKNNDIVTKLRNELEEARKIAIDAKTERDTMQRKYEGIEQQIIKMGVRNKQALDLVRNKNETKFTDQDCLTERESELYTELLATKVALKDYEDKIKHYEKEKLRIIHTIEHISGVSDDDNAALGATLVKREEEITQLEYKIQQFERTISDRTLENETLKAEIRNLQTRLETIEQENVNGASHDLKKMICEGRAKLNETMRKSLENEQKIIQYQHDMNKQATQLREMENLLRVRDGLVSLMKVKKDELRMENESLNRYANEVRELLLEAREELRGKSEAVEELNSNLEGKEKLCIKLEKKIKELESTLTLTNEKRFKLQDTLGSVEKELQSTKAHINQMSEVQTRYDDTGPDLNSSNSGDGPVRIKITVR